jgi:acetyl esterase/lipase
MQMKRNLRRLLSWTFIFAAALFCLVAAAFVVSPWPSVLIISRAFSGNDAASEAALEKYVPPTVVTVRDVPYGVKREERLDIHHPSDAGGALPLVLWVHGGGWIGGSKDGVSNYLKILAGHGYVTVGIDYSTAPGAHYPTPVRQANEALSVSIGTCDQLRNQRKRYCAGRRFRRSANRRPACKHHF